MRSVRHVTLSMALHMILGAACFAQHHTQTNIISNSAGVAPVTASELTTPSTSTITVAPKRAAVTVTTQTQQFTASNGAVTWSVDSVVGGDATVGTITTGGFYRPPATPGTRTVTATSATSAGSATIAVTDLAAVPTYHNDAARDGINVHEYALTPTTVTTATFGRLFACAVDGAVYAQPLWMRGMSIAGGI